jgi:hypothetical protein
MNASISWRYIQGVRAQNLRENPMILPNSRVMEMLTGELELTEEEIALGLKSCRSKADSLPISLWKYGFISIQQLDRLLQIQTE